MQTSLIEGVDPLPNDDKVLSIIESNDDPYDGGRAFRVCFLNHAGKPYRLAIAETTGELCHLEIDIQKAGFTNDVGIDEPSRDGFIAIYRPPALP